MTNTNFNSLSQMAYSIPQFCKSHSISKAKFYLLIKEGMAPNIMKVGKRRLISCESAKEWRKKMEGNLDQNIGGGLC